MSAMLIQKSVREMNCGQCFAYVLDCNDAFLTTEYKVMQSQKDNVLIKCIKMLMNGHTMLFYMPGNLRPLESLLPYMDEHELIQIMENLLGNIISVRDNGFLSWENLVVDASRIYVDKATGNTSLVYLPVASGMSVDSLSFENMIRTSLAALLNKWEEGEVLQLRQRLENRMLSLEEVIPGTVSEVKKPFSSVSTTKQLTLMAVNTASGQELVITKTPCVIGRHPKMADMAVGFSKAIGRRHCKIEFRDNQYFITDLESKNCTYVNKQRLLPNTSQALKNGDRVRLADVDFRVEIV